MNPRKITLVGSQKDIPTLAALVLAQWQLLKQVDVGQIVGAPEDYYVRRNPVGLKLVIVCRHYHQRRDLRTRITIPWIERSKITWQAVKEVPGQDGYVTGKKYAAYRLQHESGIGQLKVFASTGAEAEKILRRAANLSEGQLLGGRDGRIISPPVSTETLENPMSENVRVKPHYFTIINQRQKLKALAQGQASKALEQKRFFLYYERPPSDYAARIKEALSLGDNE